MSSVVTATATTVHAAAGAGDGCLVLMVKSAVAPVDGAPAETFIDADAAPAADAKPAAAAKPKFGLYKSGVVLNDLLTKGGNAKVKLRVERFLARTTQMFARVHGFLDGNNAAPAGVAALVFKTLLADRADCVAKMSLPDKVASHVMSYVVALRRDAAGAKARREKAQARREKARARREEARAQAAARKAKASKDAKKAFRAVKTAEYKAAARAAAEATATAGTGEGTD